MPRQTKSFLIERFREMGIRPATRHGQNFLIDLNLVDPDIMTAEEREWLNLYHAQVRESLSHLVDEETRAWLERATVAI